MNQNISSELFITPELKLLIENKFFNKIRFKRIPLYDEVLYFLRERYKIHIKMDITEGIWFSEIVKINGVIECRDQEDPNYYYCLNKTIKEIIKYI
jgi:hypothetical protein